MDAREQNGPVFVVSRPTSRYKSSAFSYPEQRFKRGRTVFQKRSRGFSYSLTFRVEINFYQITRTRHSSLSRARPPLCALVGRHLDHPGGRTVRTIYENYTSVDVITTRNGIIGGTERIIYVGLEIQYHFAVKRRTVTNEFSFVFETFDLFNTDVTVVFRFSS